MNMIDRGIEIGKTRLGNWRLDCLAALLGAAALGAWLYRAAGIVPVAVLLALLLAVAGLVACQRPRSGGDTPGGTGDG